MDIKISFLLFISLACTSGETVEQANALLLTTLDSICLIYPKEMNYENDFLHIIFKLSLNKSNYRVEDAVYDNKTWSIYFTISKIQGGSELIRLKRKTNFVANKSSPSDQFDFSFNIASNWVINKVYKNNYSKILSLDINPFKRKLYWIEFNTKTFSWYFTVGRLSGSYFFANNLHQILVPNQVSFSTDGYSYIGVIRDNYMNDISFFISNNQSLNLCHLINMTCVDYFRASLESTQTKSTTNLDANTYRFLGLFDEDYYDTDKTTFSHTTSRIADGLYEQVFRYGKLMGIKYDPESNSMYLSDYLNDRIDKVSFADENFKLKNIETVLKSEFLSNSVNHVALNPIMSFMYDNYVYWIDYEEGLKTSLLKSTCFRSIYKIKNAVSLKLITLKLNFNYDLKIKNDNVISSYFNRLMAVNENDLIGLKTMSSKFKYPPDYVYYYSYVLNQNGTAKFFDFDFDKNFSQKFIINLKLIFCFIFLLL